MQLQRLAVALLALSLVACSTTPIMSVSAAAASTFAFDWNGFVARYIEPYLAAHPALRGRFVLY